MKNRERQVILPLPVFTQTVKNRQSCYDNSKGKSPRIEYHKNGGRLWLHLRKGGGKMPITLTFHIFGYTVTIRIKARSRHSAK